LEFLARTTRQEQEIKMIQIGKEEVILSLFADDMIFHLQDPKISMKALLEITNNFGKMAEYKVNIWISVAFLYTNNEQTEKEIRETILFIILSKIPANNFNEIKGLFNENYKSPKREIKEKNQKI
jgi:hypothetical protein